MAENRHFQEALANFTADFAYVGAVKHLYDLGYSAENIQKELAYPVSLEKIQRVVDEYEASKHSPQSQYEFVQDTDSLGRKSFRRVKKEIN